LRLKRCEQLIKQGFISKATHCLQDKALPIPKNANNRDRLKVLHPPDRHMLGDLRDDGSIVEIILDQANINSLPNTTIDPIVVSRHIRKKKRLTTPSGTTSTRNEHLQELIKGPEGDIALNDLTLMIEICINYQAPQVVNLFMQLICLANELDMPTRERGHQALVFF
jgi:hypothetical protein